MAKVNISLANTLLYTQEFRFFNIFRSSLTISRNKKESRKSAPSFTLDALYCWLDFTKILVVCRLRNQSDCIF